MSSEMYSTNPALIAGLGFLATAIVSVTGKGQSAPPWSFYAAAAGAAAIALFGYAICRTVNRTMMLSIMVPILVLFGLPAVVVFAFGKLRPLAIATAAYLLIFTLAAWLESRAAGREAAKRDGSSR